MKNLNFKANKFRTLGKAKNKPCAIAAPFGPEEASVDTTFANAKKGACSWPNAAGKSVKMVGVAAGNSLPLAISVASAGDGLTVVSAMLHSNPKAVTIIFSAFPEMKEAAAAILAQTADVIVKPQAIGNLVALIREKLEEGKGAPRVLASVTTVLKEDSEKTIEDWLSRVRQDEKVLTVWLDDVVRSSHLPQLFCDLVFRLQHPQPLGSRALIFPSAAEHGLARRLQGYTASILVEESRMLQFSIFQTLQNNLNRVNFSLILVSVMENSFSRSLSQCRPRRVKL